VSSRHFIDAGQWRDSKHVAPAFFHRLFNLRRFAPLPRGVIVILLLLISTSCRHHRNGPVAYVSNEKDGTVSVIDTTTDKVISIITVGGRARGIRISPDGRRLYVALSTPQGERYRKEDNKIAAIDTDSEKVVKWYDVGSDPEQLGITRDGSRLFVSNEDSGTATITDIGTGNNIKTIVAGIEPEGVSVSPDGRWVYITSETSNSITVVDASANNIVKTFLVGSRPRDAAFSPDGSRAYVSAEMGRTLSVVDTRNHDVLHTVQIPQGDGVKPMGVAVSNDGQRVFLATGKSGRVLVINADTFQIDDSIPVGQRVWGIALTPDGKKLYTANGLSNDVSVIDTATDRVIASIKVGQAPWGVAIRP
jgi:PQQ-dependent catabolism-associated beta-propeller protein